MLTLIALVNILIIYLVYKSNLKFSFVHLSVITFIIMQTGVFILSSQNEQFKPFIYYACFLVVFVVGIYSQASIAQRHLNIFSPIISDKKYKMSVYNQKLLFMVLPVATLICYHYAVVGIPVFSADVETARFQASRSGLFGIPSRIVNFGIYIILIFAIVARSTGFIKKRLFFIFLLLCGTVIMFAGMKSSILTIVLVMLVSYRFTKYSTKYYYFALVMMLSVSIVYAIIMAGRYATTANMDIVKYFLTRIFIIGADTYYYVVTMFTDKFGYGYGAGIVNDLIYPLKKLMNPSGTELTLLSQISMAFYNTPEENLIVPITPTIFGYLYTQFGLWGTLIMSFLLGALSVRLYLLTNRQSNIQCRTLMIVVEYATYLALTTGNIIYVITNYISTIMLLMVIWMTTSRIYRMLQYVANDNRQFPDINEKGGR